MAVVGHTSPSCDDRQGLCPISLLCGCSCHIEAEDDEVEEALTPREMAELLIAGTLAGAMALLPAQPVRVAQDLLEMLERNNLRIVTA